MSKYEPGARKQGENAKDPDPSSALKMLVHGIIDLLHDCWFAGCLCHRLLHETKATLT